MFTDREKFLFRYPGTSVSQAKWVQKGQRHEAHTVNHPMAVNMYAGITMYGVTKLHIVAGTSKLASTFHNQKGVKAKNITTADYTHVMLKTLLPEGRRLFGSHGITTWILQKDNDPTHKGASRRAITEWDSRRNGSQVSLLPDWPPNSPDLIPIEDLWSIM